MWLELRAWCDCATLFSATLSSTCFLLLVYVSLELSKFWLWCVDYGPVLSLGCVTPSTEGLFSLLCLHTLGHRMDNL
jgi:hypothetical protein